MFEIIPYILWAFVALFVWWLCGTLSIVLGYLCDFLEHKAKGWRVYPEDLGMTTDEKKGFMSLGPVGLLIVSIFILCYAIRWGVGSAFANDRFKRIMLSPFQLGAIIGTRIGDWLVATFITKSKGF